MKKLMLWTFLLLIMGKCFSYEITFIYTLPASSVQVAIKNFPASTYNMEKISDSFWKYDIDLQQGKYYYQYIVDGKETYDPDNNDYEIIQNRFLNYKQVGEDETGMPKLKYEHSMKRMFINPVRYGEIYLCIGVEKATNQKINILVNGDIASTESFIIDDTQYQRFHVKSSAKLLKYLFVCEKDNKVYTIGSSKDGSKMFEFDFDNPQISYFDPPQWTKGSIYYQIFPDRFFNGDTENDPLAVRPWYEEYTSNTLSSYFYGGDLAGIIEKIDYLKELSVGCIYMNPIFEAPSTHKYNTTDYLKVDPSFGNEKILSDLIQKAHSQDIKILLDGVFNHTGDTFFAMKENFLRQQKSQYLDWYHILSFPITKSSKSYKCWWDYPDLPQLNLYNPKVRAYIAQVVSKWSGVGTDGWRLDAVDQIPNWFWKEFFMPLIKGINKDLFIVGEYWKDSSIYFEEPSFDSVMNYIFRDAAIAYAKGGSSQNFINSVSTYLKKYPPQVLHSLWNMLGSHDTERIFTVLGQDFEKLRIAVALQMTFIGSPIIYYGDEAGLTGEKDPFCRKPFPWDKERFNNNIYSLYKTLTAFRAENAALKYGSFKVICSKLGILAYEREYENDKVIVIMNSRSSANSCSIELDSQYKDLFSGTYYKKIETVGPKEVLILYRER